MVSGELTLCSVLKGEITSTCHRESSNSHLSHILSILGCSTERQIPKKRNYWMRDQAIWELNKNQRRSAAILLENFERDLHRWGQLSSLSKSLSFKESMSSSSENRPWYIDQTLCMWSTFSLTGARLLNIKSAKICVSKIQHKLTGTEHTQYLEQHQARSRNCTWVV